MVDCSAEADLIEAQAATQENNEEDLSQKSVPIDDPSLQRLYDWVLANGGIFNCESRADSVTGVRGLYATKDLNDPTEPVIQIPSKIIVSPYHIYNRYINQDLQYGTLFEANPEVFHSKYPFEASTE